MRLIAEKTAKKILADSLLFALPVLIMKSKWIENMDKVWKVDQRNFYTQLHLNKTV